MRKKSSGYKGSKSKTKAYLYALANEATGLELIREIYAPSLKEAEAAVNRIARCFGPSTEVVSVELADQPELPLRKRR